MKAVSFTWAGGVISPGLAGRVDLNKYQTGLKTAENFHIGIEGGVYKRWGLYYVGKPKYQDKDCKLVPWEIAPDDSYVLEFGDEYIRVIRLGGYVLYPGGHTPHADSDAISVSGFLEIPSPYLAEHVGELKFTFANDVVYIFHKLYQPATLKRLGLYDWDYELIDFNPHGSAPTGLTGVLQRNIGSGTTMNWQTADLDQPSYDENLDALQYRISATMANGLETMASSPITVNADLGYPGFRVKLTWSALTGAEKYTIYKGKTGIFGFIGYVDAAATLEFMDKNYAPSYDVVPIQEFEGFDTEDSTGEWPRVGEFYKQRMGYAATISQPQTLWFSRALFFDAMTTSIPLQDDDAIKTPLVGNKRHTINHLVQLKKFLAFTDTAEWVIQGADGAALSPGTIDPVAETAYGSKANLQPLSIGERILFVQNISNAIRDMGYEFTSDAYRADNLSRLARHLFENKEIISWDYADFPHNAVWCVTDEGDLPCMTYVREDEIWGWSRMTTQGVFYDVAVVPEINQHATYFQTLRTVNGTPTRFIERSEALFTDRVEEMFFVDCGLTYVDPREFTGMTRLLNVLTITLVSHGLAIDDEVEIETADFRERFVVDNVVGNVLTLSPKYPVDVPEDLTVDYGTLFVCGDLITGFGHLANQTGLVALADGKVVHNITVAADGTFLLPFQAARVHAGFPYEADLETLNLDFERAVGQYNVKAVHEISVHLHNSRGVYVGPSASARDLEPIEGRSDENYDKPNELLDGIYTVSAHPAWERTGGVRINAPDPLPCQVLNIIPDIEYER